MQNLELGILNWIQASCRTGFMDAAMPLVSALCDHGEVWIVLAAVLLARKGHRRTGAVLAAALILDLLCCNVILKPLIARARPFAVSGAAALLVAPPLDFSFPSGHTAASFAAVGALAACRSRLWPPALALACAIAFSRLYLYVHWPSDVLAGAALGAVLGVLAARLVRWAERRRTDHTNGN